MAPACSGNREQLLYPSVSTRGVIGQFFGPYFTALAGSHVQYKRASVERKRKQD